MFVYDTTYWFNDESYKISPFVIQSVHKEKTNWGVNVDNVIRFTSFEAIKISSSFIAVIPEPIYAGSEYVWLKVDEKGKLLYEYSYMLPNESFINILLSVAAISKAKPVVVALKRYEIVFNDGSYLYTKLFVGSINITELPEK